MSKDSVGTRLSEERCDVGYDPGVTRWHIEQVGTITVDRYGRYGREKVSYPGWVMRSIEGDPNAPMLATTSAAYASGPGMASKLRIGGWSVQELQDIAGSTG